MEDRINSKIKILSQSYSKVEKEFSNLRKHSLKNGTYNYALKAAFIKNLEFNINITSNTQFNFYFQLPFLRSLCEDIICINFLKTNLEKSDREIFIKYLHVNDSYNSVIKQENFFQKENEHHPIPMISMLEPSKLDIMKGEIKKLKIKYGWKKEIPSVWEMAKESNLDSIYNYIYHATSRLVHFNPGILFRLGQITDGRFPKSQDEIDDLQISISTTNFELYTKWFCIFYGSFLFLEFIKHIDEIELTMEKFETLILPINEVIYDNTTWPTIINFQELNMDLFTGMVNFWNNKYGLEEATKRAKAEIEKNPNFKPSRDYNKA